MKQVLAIIKPYLAERVLEAVSSLPLDAVVVREVKGHGRQKSYLDQYSATEFSEAFLPKVEITISVDDLYAEDVVNKIVAVARTGRMGDGKILVLPVWSAISIESDSSSVAPTTRQG